jgi:hypothetical protein
VEAVQTVNRLEIENGDSFPALRRLLRQSEILRCESGIEVSVVDLSFHKVALVRAITSFLAKDTNETAYILCQGLSMVFE